MALHINSTARQLNYVENRGGQTTQMLFNDTNALSRPGQFVKRVDPSGVVTSVTSTTGSNIQEQQRSFTVGGTTTYESTYYNYYTSGANVGKIQYVTLRRGPSSTGPWTLVNRTAFEYYDGTTSNGSLNDLETSSDQLYNGSSWDTVSVSYYRYYKTGAANGFAHGLMLDLGPEAYRLAFNDGVDFDTATTATLQTYADHYFEYDPTSRAVTLEIAAVCDSCPGGGTSSDTFSYTPRSGTPTIGYNSWSMKTVQTLPLASPTTQIIVYSNYAGNPILQVYVSGSDQWYSFWRYDDNGRVIVEASSSAITGYDESFDDLVDWAGGTYVQASSGLLQTTNYYDIDTNQGQVYQRNVAQGQGGSDILTEQWAYTTHTDSGGNEVVVPSQMTQYPTAGGTGVVTSYSYTWYTGMNQMASRTTTLPAIGSGQNGSGTSATTVELFDVYGNLTQKTDERGVVNTYTYDVVLGVMTQQALDTGGLNLVTDFTYDIYGRLIQTLGPSHTVVISGTATTVRKATWIVYTQSVLPGSGTWDLDQVWTGQGYATGSSPSYTYTLIDPVAIQQNGKDGKNVDSITSHRTTGSGARAHGYLCPDRLADLVEHAVQRSGSDHVLAGLF